jgi:hypothetical protein
VVSFFPDEVDAGALKDGEAAFEIADDGEAFGAADRVVEREDGSCFLEVRFRDIEESADLFDGGEGWVVDGDVDAVGAEACGGEAGDFQDGDVEEDGEEFWWGEVEIDGAVAEESEPAAPVGLEVVDEGEVADEEEVVEV